MNARWFSMALALTAFALFASGQTPNAAAPWSWRLQPTCARRPQPKRAFPCAASGRKTREDVPFDLAQQPHDQLHGHDWDPPFEESRRQA